MVDVSLLPMRVAVGQTNDLTDEFLAFAVQCGVEDVQVNTPRLPGEERWEYEDLVALRSRANAFGLRLICIENVPIRFYDQIMLGSDGRERQLQNMIATVRNIAQAGIPLLGYHWMPNGVWRTDHDTPIRGGARSNRFEMEAHQNAPLSHGRRYTSRQMWANYNWYLERILPVCEEVGLRLALHPDDPPVPELAGVARLFGSFEGFARAMELHPSPMHGLDFCHGCWSEMRGGAGILDAIRHFGAEERIFYVHMRDVQGSAESFTECFIDEGNSHIPSVLRTLKSVGFRGFLLDDHVPRMVNDTPWGHRGRAYSTGYLRGALAAVISED